MPLALRIQGITGITLIKDDICLLHPPGKSDPHVVDRLFDTFDSCPESNCTKLRLPAAL
jgi:hypothetical protein